MNFRRLETGEETIDISTPPVEPGTKVALSTLGFKQSPLSQDRMPLVATSAIFESQQ